MKARLTQNSPLLMKSHAQNEQAHHTMEHLVSQSSATRADPHIQTYGAFHSIRGRNTVFPQYIEKHLLSGEQREGYSKAPHISQTGASII